MCMKRFCVGMLVLGMLVSAAQADWTYVECVDHALHPLAATNANMYFDANATEPVNAVTAWNTNEIRFRSGRINGYYEGTLYEIHASYGDPAVYVLIDTGAPGTYNIKLYGGFKATDLRWNVQTSLDGGMTWSENITGTTIDDVNGIDGQGWVTSDTDLGSPATPDGDSRGNVIIGQATTDNGLIVVGIQKVGEDRGQFDGLAYKATGPQAGLVTKAASMAGFDFAIVDRLESMGYAVSIIDSADVKNGVFTVEDAETLDVIVVSEVIGSSDVIALNAAKVPMMNGEGYGWHKMNYAEADGTASWRSVNDPNGNPVVLVDETHPIAVNAGVLAGPIPYLLNENATTTCAAVSGLTPSAANIASIVIEDVEYALIFAINEGMPLAKDPNLTAPARIVGFSLPGNQDPNLSDEGWALFDAAIRWLDPAPVELVVPIAEYSFDVDASDATGSFDGTFQGDAAIVDDAERGAVLGLTADGYVSVPPVLANELDNFSFSTWVNFNGTVSWAGLLGMGSATKGKSPYWDFHMRSNGNLSYYATEAAVWPGDGSAQTVTGYKLPAAEWTHIAFTFTLGTGGAVYINGVAQTLAPWSSSNDHDVSPSAIAAEIVTIGRDTFNQGTLTNTKIDDFKFYNTALSADDVVAIYDAEKTN